MAGATTESSQFTSKPSPATRIADAIRHASHFSHEARMAGSMARDAGEEGVYAAKRAVKRMQRRVEALEDAKDDATRYVKHQPFTAVAMAAGVGLAVGVVVGWIGSRFGQRHACS